MAIFINMNKNWVHPPTALTQGHVIYNVKFLGQTEVDSPKGAEMVKEAIRKLKFSRHIKKAEGNKPPKMELTISSEGIALQDPKTKEKLHTFPLHRISYCADDKTDKKICAFIGKETPSNRHLCFVLDSEKCAEEITLTVGQAFDLAYRKFLDTSGRDMEMKKQFLALQKKLQEVEAENTKLKQRVAELEALTGQQSTTPSNAVNSLQASLPKRSSSPLTSVESKTPQLTLKEQALQHQQALQSQPQADHLFEMEPFSPTGAGTHNGFPHSAPSKSNTTLPLASPAVPIAPALAPPPPVPARPRTHASATSTPPPPPRPAPAAPSQPSATAPDPFGSGPFTAMSAPPKTDYDVAISNIDKHMAELQEGFGAGLTMGKDDFSLEDLDPLNQK